MKSRVITSVIYIFVWLALCAAKWLVPDGWGALGFDAVFCALSVLACTEFLRSADKSSPEGAKMSYTQRAFTVAFCAISVPLYVAAELAMNAGFLTVACALGVYILFMVGLSAFKNSKNSVKNAIWCIFAMLYCGLLPVALSAVNHLESNSLAAIVFLFMCAMLSDGGAYVIGSALKKALPKKLAPELSPHKTVIGAVGGLLGGIVGGVAAYYIIFGLGKLDGVLDFALPVTLQLFTASEALAPIWFAIAGLAFSVICQFGDLFESALKREFGVKDMGNILPGHGGVLDRFDGMMFAGLFVLLVFGAIIV